MNYTLWLLGALLGMFCGQTLSLHQAQQVVPQVSGSASSHIVSLSSKKLLVTAAICTGLYAAYKYVYRWKHSLNGDIRKYLAEQKKIQDEMVGLQAFIKQTIEKQ